MLNYSKKEEEQKDKDDNGLNLNINDLLPKNLMADNINEDDSDYIMQKIKNLNFYNIPNANKEEDYEEEEDENYEEVFTKINNENMQFVNNRANQQMYNLDAYVNPSLVMNMLQMNQRIKPVTKKKKKPQNTKIFESLNDLLQYLDGKKMLCNFVKSRENKDCLIDLVKKLTDEEIDNLVNLIKHKLKEILISSHKFCQKLFEKLKPKNRILILEQIKSNFLAVSLNKWGSISLQSVVKLISLPEEEDIVLECIKGNVCEMICNKYSNFVIQKLILVLNENHLICIIDEMFNNFFTILNCTLGFNFIYNLIMSLKSVETKKYFAKKMVKMGKYLMMDTKGANLMTFIAIKFDGECKVLIISFLLDTYSPFFVPNYPYVSLINIIKACDYKYLKIFYPSFFFNKQYFSFFIQSICGRNIISEFFKKLNIYKKNEIYKFLLNYCDQNMPVSSLNFLKEYL